MAAKLRQPADFEGRVREHERVVYQIAYSILRNRVDAEDVAQDTFVRAHAKLAELRDPKNFGVWVAQICRRLALNRLRSDSRARRRDEAAAAMQAPTLAPDAAAVTEAHDFAERVRREIDRLPPKLREAMLLTAIDGLDHAMVARMLQIPEGTVRSRLHAARKRLLQTVGE
jgi:RNA polymerase sigma-70 factor (ECF subfamily)